MVDQQNIHSIQWFPLESKGPVSKVTFSKGHVFWVATFFRWALLFHSKNGPEIQMYDLCPLLDTIKFSYDSLLCFQFRVFRAPLDYYLTSSSLYSLPDRLKANDCRLAHLLPWALSFQTIEHPGLHRKASTPCKWFFHSQFMAGGLYLRVVCIAALFVFYCRSDCCITHRRYIKFR